jgi:hypothetical protein
LVPDRGGESGDRQANVGRFGPAAIAKQSDGGGHANCDRDDLELEDEGDRRGELVAESRLPRRHERVDRVREPALPADLLSLLPRQRAPCVNPEVDLEAGERHKRWHERRECP